MQIASSREKSHLGALGLLKRGAYAEAIQAFQATLDSYGPHVGLLSDLAGAQYLLGDMGEFAMTVERLEAEFAECRGLLSRRSRVQTLITLAKFAEELGRIAEAFDHIDEALKEIPAGTPLALRTRSQKLRLSASFAKDEDVSALYRSSLSVSEKYPELVIECFHALLIAETRLLGLEHAWPRLKELMSKNTLQAADVRLCLIDMLEAAIEMGDLPAQETLLAQIQTTCADDLDVYERLLVDLTVKRFAGIDTEDLFSWSRKLAPQGMVRLLALTLAGGGRNSAVQQKLLFLLQSYDHRTQKILQRKWGHLLGGDSQAILAELNSKTRSVHLGSEQLSLQQSPLTWTLLETLCNGGVTSDVLLEKTAKCEDSIHSQESIRIALLRLNKKLSSFLGVDWVFKYRKAGVMLNDRIEWKMV